MYNLNAMKARLTRAEKSGDPSEVLAACKAAARAFKSDGYPDCWHRWNIAQQDAMFALQRRFDGAASDVRGMLDSIDSL